MTESRKVAIIGSGGLGREVLWLIREYNTLGNAGVDKNYKPFEIVGYLTNDTTMHGKIICDAPVLSSEEWLLEHRDVYAVCAIGNPRTRIRVATSLVLVKSQPSNNSIIEAGIAVPRESRSATAAARA